MTASEQLRPVLDAQGVAADAIELVRRVALRYVGSDTALRVEDGTVDELVARFEAGRDEPWTLEGHGRDFEALLALETRPE